jgi:hypothetical protein
VRAIDRANGDGDVSSLWGSAHQVKDFGHKRDETAVVLVVENTSRLFGSYRAGPQDACIALVLCVVKEKRTRFPLFEG